MKKTKQTIILLLTLTCTLLGYYSLTTAIELDNYILIAKNETLTLFFNEHTTEIAVYDQRSNQFWHSNPVNYQSIETIARGTAKDALGAQLRITFFSPGDVQKTMDNYNDSIIHGQYETKQFENGIQVKYVLGKEWDDLDYLPLIVEQDLFENQFLSVLNPSQQRAIAGLYALVEVTPPEANIKPTVVDKYVITSANNELNEREQRTIHNVFLDHLVNLKSNLSKIGDIKELDVQPFLDKPFYILKQRERDMLPWDKEEVIDIAKDVNFNPNILSEGYQLYQMDARLPNLVVFTIPIEYRLEKDNLVVNILTEGIEYPLRIVEQDGQRVTYPLVQIGLLPYFGAAQVGSNGYMFVPDGSGSLINFDNGKTHFSAFSRRIYGQDFAANPLITASLSRPIHLPVFGLKDAENALFGIIESGASIARINADVSGRRISYNTIYPSFEIAERTTASLQSDMPDIHRASAQWVTSSGSTINVYQEPIYNEAIQVRYVFLQGEESDYVGMAHYYQNYLIDKGYLTKLNSKDNIPLMLDLIGAVLDRKPILGIQRNVIVPLTTYKQAELIIKELLENNVNNIHLSYIGWMKNGVESYYPKEVKLEPKLGTKADLENLIQFTNNNQVILYPNVDFMSIYNDTLLDGFYAPRDASRALTRNVVSIGGYLLSPAKIDPLVNTYLQSQTKYNFSGLHPIGLGTLLYGDYRRGSVIIRENAIKVIQNQLAKIKNDYNLKIQVYQANDYAFPYVACILGVPLEHSGLDITDESVPFLPILLHGFIDYSGQPFNYADSSTDYLLKMLEVGAKPYFQVFNESSAILKGTLYDSLYTGQFSLILDELLEVYKLFNELFREVQDQKIIKHQQIAENVYTTVYEEGKTIIINYNNNVVTVNNRNVEPKSFLVLQK